MIGIIEYRKGNLMDVYMTLLKIGAWLIHIKKVIGNAIDEDGNP